jgi:sugar-specific transcriptional regulator TrmB
MTAARESVELFSKLGLTDLESEIYVFLLQHSPATGYKVAKGIGRSFTNTYKALESLRLKGAVLVADGKSRLSRAVPAEELLARMETDFRENRDRAAAAVDRLPKMATDTLIYQLTSVEQVYERCREILRGCEERVLIELFPVPLNALRREVEECAARRVDVTARIYLPDEIDGVNTILSPFGDENLRTFRSQWLSLFADGRQFLLALLASAGETVYQAVWSESPILAWALFGYVSSDFHHYAFRPFLDQADSTDEARAAYDRLQDSFPIGGSPGFRDLIQRIERDWQDPPARIEKE